MLFNLKKLPLLQTFEIGVRIISIEFCNALSFFLFEDLILLLSEEKGHNNNDQKTDIHEIEIQTFHLQTFQKEN